MFIKFNANTGKITNRYYADADASTINKSKWTEIPDSSVPNPTVTESEYPVFYYDDTNDTVTVQIESNTVERNQNTK